jgi:hypothetical protein
MTGLEVRKRFELLGRDGRDLEYRVQMLRRAIRLQGGTVLVITWSRDLPGATHRACVLYRIPETPLHAPV